MSVVALTVTTVSRSYQDMGAVSVAANAGGNSFTNTGTEYVYISNASVGSITCSFAITAAVDGITPAAKTVIVPAGKWTLVGPWPTNYYNDTSTPQVVNITYSGVTTLTVGAFKPGS
jgi:hypothetical protein